MNGCHPTHKTRFSDSSLFDEICVRCGATDRIAISGAWGTLTYPCPCPEPPAPPREALRLACHLEDDPCHLEE